jgi:hypothetical protein
MSTFSQFHANLTYGRYHTKMPLGVLGSKERAAYTADQERLDAQFRVDLIKVNGTDKLPKDQEESIFAEALKMAGGSTYRQWSEVAGNYQDLVLLARLADRNLFVARVHCVLSYGIAGTERFTESRAFPVGMTFAQAEALIASELRKNHTREPGPGYTAPPTVKVTITARPGKDAMEALKKATPLFYHSFWVKRIETPCWA